jgi:hypothetical protein
MKIAAIPALLALSAVAQAALVKFSVIVPDAATVEVSIGGKATALTRPDANIPLYTGQAETGSETKYKYVAAGRAETFDRALPTGAATYNDFIDRPITYANIPELPWPIEKDVSVFFLHFEELKIFVAREAPHTTFCVPAVVCRMSHVVCLISIQPTNQPRTHTTSRQATSDIQHTHTRQTHIKAAGYK